MDTYEYKGGNLTINWIVHSHQPISELNLKIKESKDVSFIFKQNIFFNESDQSNFKKCFWSQGHLSGGGK